MNERLDKELHYIYFLPYRCIKYQNISKQSQSVGIQQYQVTISNRNLLTTDIAQYLICTLWLTVPGPLVDTQLSRSQMAVDQTSGHGDWRQLHGTWVHMCFQRTKSKISDHLPLNKHLCTARQYSSETKACFTSENILWLEQHPQSDYFYR